MTRDPGGLEEVAPGDATTATDRRSSVLGGRVFADWSPLQRDPGFRAQWLGQLGSAAGRETAKYAFPIHIYLAPCPTSSTVASSWSAH